MHQTEALKADLARGLEGEIAELRRHVPGRRALEFAVFPLLWIAGAALALAPLPSSPGAWVVWAGGTLMAALGLNAFVLLLHEGM
ncbi:hypothetical protein EHM82_04225, partial [bacterium]